MRRFPAPQAGVTYLAEGGTETEIMYKYGHDLPEFSTYPLLDNPRAMADLTEMFRRYLEVAAHFGFVPLMGGLDYRASQDWASKIGVSAEQLREFQLRSIQFLRDVAEPFDFEQVYVAGVVGPRGDAYEADVEITADVAEEYHAAQLATLVEANVDLVEALTFTSALEAVGLARACAAVDLPLAMSFIVDPAGRLLTGPTLREAIEYVDAETGSAAPQFYGINCAHPFEFGPALAEDGPWLERIRMLRPNASTADKGALCTLGELDAGDPEILGSEVGHLVRRLPSVDIVGGCCGTWDDHFDAIGRRLRPSPGGADLPDK